MSKSNTSDLSISETSDQGVSIDDCLDEIGFGRFQTFLLFLCGLGFAAGTVQLMALSLIVSSLQREFSSFSDEFIRSSVTVASFSGEIIGGFLWGVIGDGFGRKPSFVGSVFFSSVFSLAIAFSNSVWVFFALRFILGLSMGGHMSNDFIFFMEFHPPKCKRWYTPLLIVFGICGVFSFFFLSKDQWRLFLGVCSAPFWILLGLRSFFPFESPRFLLAKERNSEAINVLQSMAKWNGLKEDQITSLYLLRDQSVHTPKIFSRENLISLVKASFVLFSMTFAYYGCLLWMPRMFQLKGIAQVNTYLGFLLLGLAQLPGLLWILASMRLFSKKQYSLSLNLFCCSIVAASFLLAKDKVSVLFVNSLLYFFIVGCWTVLYTCTPTLFPTLIRSRTAAITGISAKIGGMIASPVASFIWKLSLSNTQDDLLVWIVYSTVFMIASFVSITLPFK